MTFGGDFRSDHVTFYHVTDDVEYIIMIMFDWILNARNIDYFRRNFLFSENKKQSRYLIMNLLSFSVTSIFMP